MRARETEEPSASASGSRVGVYPTYESYQARTRAA